MFKRKADGSFKARAVAQGWNQVPGLDSGSIYAPVCMIQSVRIICCIAVHFGLLLHQMDVSTAFLYADIQEFVFVEQPPGFEVKDKDGGELVMQLEKSVPAGWPKTPGTGSTPSIPPFSRSALFHFSPTRVSACTITTVFGST